MRTEENADQRVVAVGAPETPCYARRRRHYTLNWRKMLARGIAVVGPTVQLELDIQAMFNSHDTPTPPE
jgi:hypothetical protein